MDTITLSEKKGRFEIRAQVNFMGDDLLVVVYGGVAHIGAVGMAQPRPSLDDPDTVAATSSVFTYVGHKEDIVVKAMSEAIAKSLDRKVVVAAGIHWDDMKAEEIEVIVGICHALTAKVIKRVRKDMAR